jgi:hypothetical protein
MSVTYTAVLPFQDHTVEFVTGLLEAERVCRGTRKGTRKLTSREQAVLVLRWFADATRVAQLIVDHGIKKSTGYDYLHEGIRVLAAQAPDLHNVLLAAKLAGHGHVIVDGTLIETDRVRTPGPTKNVDLWWSGKHHHHHGGNVQVVSAPDDGWILWVSDVRPGREHDTTAARAQDIDDALDDFRGIGGETFADLGYEGLQGTVTVPFKTPKGGTLTDDQKKHSRIHNALRAVGERANALLKHYKALRNISLDPWKIGLIAKAALVLIHTDHRRTT